MDTLFAPQSPAWTAMAMVFIASSSVLYTWIWNAPNKLRKLVQPADPCQRMAMVAHVLKVLQFLSVTFCTDWAVVGEKASKLELLIPAFVLVAFGQLLNFRVYQLLGRDGVYYGFRFGKQIPWQTSWPYGNSNSLVRFRDPQYVGSMSTLVGLLILGGPIVPLGWWLANYCYLMWLESEVPKDADSEKTH